jgi:ABC-type dipeptide/oligopeptide/nickel transport system ATPase subunit
LVAAIIILQGGAQSTAFGRIRERGEKDMTAPLIVAKNLQKRYQMGEVTVHALRGVDFTLYHGELVVVLGPSGSGKSTLLNIIGGMDRASAGELYFGEKSLHNAPLRGSSPCIAAMKSVLSFNFTI